MDDAFGFGQTQVGRPEVPPEETGSRSSSDWGSQGSFGETVRPMSAGTQVFGRFTLIRQLGRGGMGIVWLAEDDKLRREVALKFVPELVRMDETAVAELRRETRRGMQMNHPHIVKVFDFMEDDSRVAIVMEYIEGGTLAKALLQQPARMFEVAAIREPVMQLLDALEYTHSSIDLFHRDLKPANLMLAADRSLKVADFGIACSLRDSASRVSVKHQAAGTLLYMSPQQLMGETPTASDDIYAVGATLYELLTGKPPFHGGDLTLQLQTKVPPSLAQRRMEYGLQGAPVPPEWELAVAACLSKNPGGRPLDIAALRDALQGKAFAYGKKITDRVSFSGAGAPAVGQPSPLPPPQAMAAAQPSGKNKTWIFAATGAAALAIAAGLYLTSGNEAAPKPAETDVADQQKLDAEAMVTKMRQRFDEVFKASADKSINHQAREWRKLHEEIRSQSTIHSSVDDELKDRVKKLADSAEQEVALEEAAYAKTIDAMKKEGEALIKEEERADKSAALKQKGWLDFVAKWSAVKIPEVVGVEHQQVLQLAKDNAEGWADKARNERQMTNGLGDLFTEPNVMAWSIGSKEQILKQVQAKLKSEGVYADVVDGEYGSKSGDAISAFQTSKGFPATGKLDKVTLDALGINRTTEPAPAVVASRSNGSSGNSNGSSSREPQGYEKAAGWINAFAPLAGKIGPPRFP